MLVIAAVYASDQDATSACLRAKLAFESRGINFLKVTADPASGNISVMFYLFT